MRVRLTPMIPEPAPSLPMTLPLLVTATPVVAIVAAALHLAWSLIQ